MYKYTVQLKGNITSAQSKPVYYLLTYYLYLLFTMSSYKLGNEIQLYTEVMMNGLIKECYQFHLKTMCYKALYTNIKLLSCPLVFLYKPSTHHGFLCHTIDYWNLHHVTSNKMFKGQKHIILKELQWVLNKVHAGRRLAHTWFLKVACSQVDFYYIETKPFTPLNSRYSLSNPGNQ